MDAHLLQPLFGSFHLVGWSMFDDVSLDLSFAVLSKVVYLVAKSVDFKLFEFIQNAFELQDSISCTERKPWGL
jgi:hypothetical protein